MKLEQDGLVHNHLFNESNLQLGSAFTEGFKLVESELFVTVADDMLTPMFKNTCWLTVFSSKINSDESIGCVNFVGSRCSFNSFNRRTRPQIYERIKNERGKRLRMFKKLQKIL